MTVDIIKKYMICVKHEQFEKIEKIRGFGNSGLVRVLEFSLHGQKKVFQEIVVRGWEDGHVLPK